MKILITGAGGQVATELSRVLEDWDIVLRSRSELDITNHEALEHEIRTVNPDWVVNAAAYTAVDRAEDDEDVAYAVNAEAPGKMAQIIATMPNTRLLHISTDYVFDGDSTKSYTPTDQTNPLNIYGKSKLAGEMQILHALQEDMLVIRTGWVYSASGNNFVKTMMRLMQDRDTLNVVDDQVGSPTWAYDFARVIRMAMEKDIRGLHHWTDAGVASWFDFAKAVWRKGKFFGVLDESITILPVSSSEYPTKAKRPGFTIMDKSSLRSAIGYKGMHWGDALELMIQEYINE